MRATLTLAMLGLSGCMGDIATVVVEPDAQTGAVGGVETDSGVSVAAGNDAGVSPDAGSPDAGPLDAGPPSHASCSHSADVKGSTARSALDNPYQAWVPASYDPSRPMPLVVALHGAGDTAPSYLQWMWQANADARGFIVIAPEGTAAYGGGYAWYGSDDALVLAAIEDIVKCYSIDPKRIILNGFSAGGTMAYFIGLSQAQRFSGLAIQSSALSAGEYVNGGPLLPAAWHVPVSHFHGDMDMNFTAASALDGIEALMAAGHPTFWHLFSGGHQATAQDALTEYDELKAFTAP
jgi:poly(3-hydroxybutyrate) depolymerase